MGALLFRRPMHGRDPLPYAAWLGDRAGSVVVFTLKSAPDDGKYALVERFDSFEACEARALELHEHFGFDTVFAQSEHDVLRAAELRARIGARGQSIESARAYRDKILMKDLARAAGIRTPAYAALDGADLRRFASEHGLPCVVKPRLGAGSRGVAVLRTSSDLERFAARPPSPSWMVEAWVEAPVFHVDGLADGREVRFASVSRYVNTCLSFQSGDSMGSVVLDPSRPLAKRLVATTQSLIAALPPAASLAFHAELFVDAEDEVLLCEVACRPGGSRTCDAIAASHGVDLYEHWVKGGFGVPLEPPSPRAWSSAGRLLIPPRAARLRAIPASVPFDWVADYRPNAKPGQRCDAPESSGDNIASFILRGPDAEEVESRIGVLDRWFRERVEWEETPQARPRGEDGPT